MRLKSKDIAAALGISLATVSMALNGRQGVNDKTKQKILEYVKQQTDAQAQQMQSEKCSCKGTVMMLVYIKNGRILERHAERMDYTDQIESAVKQKGFRFYFKIFYEHTGQLQSLIQECRQLDLKGIYIMAAEMQKADIFPFLELGIPIVVGDNLFYEKGIDSYLIDNAEGIKRGVDYLVDKGHSHIVYLAEDTDIFNFNERRAAFVEEMEKRKCGDASRRIRRLGDGADKIYESMCRYLDGGIYKVTAFVLESDEVSLGVSKALMERQFQIGCSISLIGFDLVPLFCIPKLQLTLIKGTHSRRHLDGIKHLMERICDENEEIMKVYYRTHFLEGNSVFDKKQYIYT